MSDIQRIAEQVPEDPNAPLEDAGTPSHRVDVLDKMIAALQDQYDGGGHGSLAMDLDEGEVNKIADIEGGVAYGLFPLDEMGNIADIDNPTRRFTIRVEEV